jgi:hypothetical protein
MTVSRWINVDFIKYIIFVVMLVVTATSVYLSIQLRRLLSPLAQRLAELHQNNGEMPGLPDRLLRIKQRYISLFNHVDDVNTAEFSAGEIDTLSLRFLARDVTAADAQSWLRQAPSLLISLGLLGTFAGLTVGLSKLRLTDTPNTGTLSKSAIEQLVSNMGAAFETSLLGLFLSLLLLMFTQFNGSRDCLERCESLLSSWLETVLPQQLGNKISTPLRQSIENLNSTVAKLPHAIYTAIQGSMREAFEEKLNALFNINANLATEARTAIDQLSVIANAFHESGDDFLQAAQAFRQSEFATSLQQSVYHLLNSGEQLTLHSNKLSQRLVEIRDSLLSTQAEWKLLASTAGQELQTSRSMNEQFQKLIPQWQAITEAFNMGSLELAEAGNQLRLTRLEVMRERPQAEEIAESLRMRLDANASLSASCQSFAASLAQAQSSIDQIPGILKQLESLDHTKYSDITLSLDRTQNYRHFNSPEIIIVSPPTISIDSISRQPSFDESLNQNPSLESDPAEVIAAIFQDFWLRADRIALKALTLGELNVTDDSEKLLGRGISSPSETYLRLVNGGGSYLLMEHASRFWIVPTFQSMTLFVASQPDKGVFSYKRSELQTSELLRPAEVVREAGDDWVVIQMGVLSVPR